VSNNTLVIRSVVTQRAFTITVRWSNAFLHGLEYRGLVVQRELGRRIHPLPHASYKNLSG